MFILKENKLELYAVAPLFVRKRKQHFEYIEYSKTTTTTTTTATTNKGPMGHIAHMRKQFKPINTYDYIISLIKTRKKIINFMRIYRFFI